MVEQNLLFPVKTESEAVFSACRKYRYTLWRRWNDGSNYVQFICLNPSTADEFKDDNTIRKCTTFAKAWGYDSLCMTNLFAFRSTDPLVMKEADNPVGDENDKWIMEVAKDARLIIAAWSCTHGSFLNRDEQIKKALNSRLFCLRQNAAGHPWHPLYLPGNTKPVPFNF